MTREEFYEYATKKQRSKLRKFNYERRYVVSRNQTGRSMVNAFHAQSYLSGMMDAYDKLMMGEQK